MVFKILLRQIGFGLFLLVTVRRVILVIFVPTATSLTMVISTLGFQATLTRFSLPWNTGVGTLADVV
jgi:hypothetical protein